MFEVHVDISLFTKTAAFGMLSGSLNLPVIPQVGDVIAFRLLHNVDAYCDGIPFGGHLRVTTRIISPDAGGGVLLVMEDLTAATSDDARLIMEMLAENYGLLGDVWEN